MSDIVVIGGGIMGLAIALEFRLRGATVTVLSRDTTEAAALAAAGMLAPQAEQIPPSPMLDLCLRSRDLYPGWVQKLERLSGRNTGYWPCGILAPAYHSPSAGLEPAEARSTCLTAQWFDATTIHQHQSGLGAEVDGGWWYPDDAQVDSRALMLALRNAALEVDVHLRDRVEVLEVQTQATDVINLRTTAGDWQAGHYILATGAWSQALLPIPVTPQKGQMLSVHPVVPTSSPPLQCVLFGDESYIVPRQDGRVVIGATSEQVGFAPHNTPAGIQALLTRATRLYPPLAEMAIAELWWGFRPATPDTWPILGKSPYRNLTLATGHHRNGILLAPVTAQLIADWVADRTDPELLQAFDWSRFAGSRPSS